MPAAINKITHVPLPEELAAQFLEEVLAVIAPFETYSEARDALWKGYFAELKTYAQTGDFDMLRQLPRPQPLTVLVESGILYGFFRTWLRKQGIDPSTVFRDDWAMRFDNPRDELLTPG